jgi:hypothetical protein
VIILSFLLVVFYSGCSALSSSRHHEEVRNPETPVARVHLPLPPQGIIHHVEFNDPADGSRVTLKDRSDIERASYFRSILRFQQEEAFLVQQALANIDVRNLLGTRYTLISVAVADEERPRLTFYSYSDNVTVEMDMKGARVVKVQRREGYIPLEGAEEIKEAIALARKDTRIGGQLADLEGHAIVMQPKRGIMLNDPGYGHRVFWVTFSEGLTGSPQYWAVVDLTNKKVLKTGKEEPHP